MGLKSLLPLRLLGFGKPLPLPIISIVDDSILIFYHNYEMKTEGCVATVREWQAQSSPFPQKTKTKYMSYCEAVFSALVDFSPGKMGANKKNICFMKELTLAERD